MIIFFINSKTINIDNYNIKNIPGSSGRLDVISRCILAALIENDRFEKNVQIWVFLESFGTYIFSPEFFNYKSFPKNEISFTDHFVKFLQKEPEKKKLSINLLSAVKESKMSLVEAITHFEKLNYSLYILSEQGQDFFTLLRRIKGKKNNVFIIGSQEDEYLYSKELSALNFPSLSIGNQSYLASSVIRLVKLYLLVI
jgi:tRNA (pseudouridine54-N1)-methyltransferase